MSLLLDLAGGANEKMEQRLRAVSLDLKWEARRPPHAGLYDFASVGYATLTGSGCFQDINITGASIFGRPPYALRCGALLPLVCPVDRRRWLNYLGLVRKTTRPQTIELKFQRPDHSVGFLHLVCEAVGYSGTEDEMIRAVFFDVTEQRGGSATK